MQNSNFQLFIYSIDIIHSFSSLKELTTNERVSKTNKRILNKKKTNRLSMLHSNANFILQLNHNSMQIIFSLTSLHLLSLPLHR